MKHKILLTSLLGLTIVCPAMAEVNVDITAGTNNPGCNNTVLHTYSGPTSLEAEYTANTITLNWYNGNQKITPTNNTANTCTYDGAIVLPTTNPTRTGYTFAGWQVRISGFDLSTLDASINGSALYGHGWYDNADYCYAYGDGTVGTDGAEVCVNESGMSDVGLQEWKTTFSYGTIYGEASCQSTLDADMAYFDANVDSVIGGEMDPYEFLANYTALAGQEKGAIAADIFTRYSNGQITYDEAREEASGKLLSSNDSKYNKNSTGQYCFCKVTGYTPLNGNKQNVVASLWVFNNDRGSAATCASNCAGYCGNAARLGEVWRVGLFGVTEQPVYGTF